LSTSSRRAARLSDAVLLVAAGPFATLALAVAPESIGELAQSHKLVITVEDNGVHGGVGSSVSAALRSAETDVPCRDVGLPHEFQAQASRGEIFADVGLTDRNIARQLTGWVAARGSPVAGEAEVSERLD
jgi:1-deoxy-D-xylulose-5-phosphate synthase